MNNDQLFNEIRALRSVTTDWAESPNGRSVMALAIVRGEATESGGPARRERPAARRTRRAAFAGIGAVTLLTTGVAAASIAFQQADSPTQAGCYESLSAQADTTEASADLVEKVGPVEACAKTLTELNKPVDVTNMVSCVNPDGGRGVFPAPTGISAQAACGQIGWAVDAG